MGKPIKRGIKWQIRWTDENGKRRGESYTDFKDAMFALRSHETQTEEIRRGFRVRPPKDRSFKDLCDRWMSVRATMKRQPEKDLSIIRTHLKPAFGELTLRQITTERVAEFSAELMSKRAPLTVRNILMLLQAMFNQAIEWGWTETAPKIRKPQTRLFNKDYRWLRTNEEIERFLDAAKSEESPTVHPMYSTALFTGMRAGELVGLRWDDIDFERRLITVQRSYDGPTKAGDVRHVPILDRLLPVLKAWKLATSSRRVVFPNEAGHMWDQKGRVFDEILKRVLVRAGFDRRYVHFHGLRHTFASHWVLNDGDLFRLQKILGHKTSQMTQRYAHLAPSAYQSDWGRLGGASESKEGEVVEIARKQKQA